MQSKFLGEQLCFVDGLQCFLSGQPEKNPVFPKLTFGLPSMQDRVWVGIFSLENTVLLSETTYFTTKQFF